MDQRIVNYTPLPQSNQNINSSTTDSSPVEEAILLLADLSLFTSQLQEEMKKRQDDILKKEKFEVISEGEAKKQLAELTTWYLKQMEETNAQVDRIQSVITQP